MCLRNYMVHIISTLSAKNLVFTGSPQKCGVKPFFETQNPHQNPIKIFTPKKSFCPILNLEKLKF